MAARFKNEKYYRKLSKKERRQFRLNCEKAYPSQNVFYRLLKLECDSFSEFVSGGFTWGNTLQGHEYWGKIACRNLNNI